MSSSSLCLFFCSLVASSQLITVAYVWGMLDCSVALWQADGLFPLSESGCCRTKPSWCVEVWLLERAVSTPSTLASYRQRGALHNNLCHVSDIKSNKGQCDFVLAKWCSEIISEPVVVYQPFQTCEFKFVNFKDILKLIQFVPIFYHWLFFFVRPNLYL